VRLLADEGVDGAIVARLRADGHDVTYVAELAPGITDDGVLALANDEGRVLLTVDKDFGELVFRLRRANSGVLLIRLAGLTSSQKADAVSEALLGHGREMLGAFAVVSASLVRIRPSL
jgi:predicted nuclease of predicted toxin-antitoxin system